MKYPLLQATLCRYFLALNLPLWFRGLLLGVGLSACSINPRFVRLPATEQTALQPLPAPVAPSSPAYLASTGPVPLDSVHVYRIDAAWLHRYLRQSRKEFTHLYLYATFCQPCIKELPQTLRQAQDRHDTNFLMVTPQS